jgi:hypothetical protein
MEKRTKDKPWKLKTPPLTSDYTMHVDTKDGQEILVCTVGTTVLHYEYRAIKDLHEMLKKHGDWMELGSKDEKQEAAPGTLAEEPDRRLVRTQEGLPRPVCHVYAAVDGSAGACRGGTQPAQ